MLLICIDSLSIQCVAVVGSRRENDVLFFSSSATASLLIQELAKRSDICTGKDAMESPHPQVMILEMRWIQDER